VLGANAEVNITFVSSNPNVCIFSFNDYVVLIKILITFVHLHII
jgi:hypothetical protein